MEQLNRIELIGTVGNVRLLASDPGIARISVMTNYAYRDRTGNAVVETAWHNVTASQGNRICDLTLLKKGDGVHLTGRVRYQKYIAVDGAEHTVTDIIAHSMEILTDKEPVTWEAEPSIRERIKSLRNGITREILDFMHRNGTKTLTITECDTDSRPVLASIPTDGRDSFTLDGITVYRTDRERLLFTASNDWMSRDWEQDDVELETLLLISEWLEAHENELFKN